MSENGRKRSRKSKLVPREFTDLTEDDLDLQEPAHKKLLLQKIKKERNNYATKESSSLEFSVNVEVEDVDGSIPDEDPSDYMKYLFSLSKESENAEPANEDFIDSPIRDVFFQKYLGVNKETIIVDIRKAQQMLPVLHKKYPNELEIVKHTRNQWGKIFYENYAVEFRRTTQDVLIQDVLGKWRSWCIKSSKARESPFSYKCYICGNAWWSLTEFKAHITKHCECKLQTEIKQQECNIIAFVGDAPVYKDIYIHGKCLKCAKTYNHHQANKAAWGAFYHCNYCNEKLYTCSALAKHEGTCDKNPIRVLSISQDGKELTFSDFSCEVCETVFLSSSDLLEHMVICHKVRSDEPIIMDFKICRVCGRNYYIFNYHVCLKRNYIYSCNYCYSNFQGKQMREHHMKSWDGMARCKICDKFVARNCMVGEHCVKHSKNFHLMHRCLLCKKRLRVFLNDSDLRKHKMKCHSTYNVRKIRSQLIIMPDIILEECVVDPNAKKTLPKILREKPPRKPRPGPFKLTRGETVKNLRVYVPVKRNTTKTDSKVSENNKTTPHDDVVTEETLTEMSQIKIKEEKDTTVNTNEQLDNNETISEEELSEIASKVIKTEKFDSPVENLEDNVGKREVKDIPKIIEELNEFIDIKPDIVRIKEEKQSEDEMALVTSQQQISKETESDVAKTCLISSSTEEMTNINIKIEPGVPNILEVSSINAKELTDSIAETDSSKVFQADTYAEVTNINIKSESDLLNVVEASKGLSQGNITESDLSQVFQASNTFAEEVTENSEHSNVFQVSKSILASGTIKREVKEEPLDSDDDLIILDSSTDSIKQESVTSGRSELSLLDLEPEVILKAGYRKRKIYKCSRCDYSGYHREYKEHISNMCMKNKRDKKTPDADLVFKCTKCGNRFANIKTYAVHFEKHGYRYMSCPQCSCLFDSITKLIPHINAHIKSQFVRIQVINDYNDKHAKVYQCKTCKDVAELSESFVHWEKHLVLTSEGNKETPEEVNSASTPVGKQALAPEMRKAIIDILTTQDKPNHPQPRRAKTCPVCDRVFERRNDSKRHLIEHLLEDAYAHMGDTELLKCQICLFVHRKPDGYKKHMRDHACLPIYHCKLCEKTFSDSSNFTKHKKIHNLKAFVCDICGKKFQAKISLEKHIEMHLTTDPIECEECHKVFTDRSFYKRHMRQHHDTMKFRCQFCRERFDTLREKWDHSWLVHKKRNVIADCPVCKLSFRKVQDVKKHAVAEHGIQITLSNAWKIISKSLSEAHGEGTRQTETEDVKQAERDSSDDDCLIIEEERETLVVYD